MESNVRIVVPMYNAQYWIKDLLDSIVAQTFTNWECVLVDDASTDRTLNVVDLFLKDLKENKPDIDWTKKFTIRVHENNMQVSATRNDGMLDTLEEGTKTYNKATYTYFCDADDVLESTLLEKAVTAADEQQVPLVQFGHLCIRGRVKDNWFKKLYPPEKIYNSIKTKWYYNLWTFLFKTEYLKKYNMLFDVDMTQGEDEFFLLQFSWHMFKEGLSYYAIPEALYLYRYLNPTSLMILCTEEDKQLYKRKLEYFMEGKENYGGVFERIHKVIKNLNERKGLIQPKDALPFGSN